MTSDQAPRELLLANLPLIRDIVGFVARRHRLSAEQAEELESFVRFRLVENDYAILGQWGRRSSLRTYLTVVVHRLFYDYRNDVWGRWRPSAAALRLGPLAQALEEQLYREGATFDEASAVLASRHGASRAELVALHERLPHRNRPPSLQSLEGSEVAPPSPALNPEEEALRRSDETTVTAAVAASLRQLRAQDRLLLRLRFREELPLPEVARGLGISQKRLMRRLKAILSTMRQDLRQSGFERHDVVKLLQGGPSLEFGLQADEGESDSARPSKGAEDRQDLKKR